MTVTYGADQYVLPFDAKGLTFYFSFSYIISNAAGIVARSVNPYFRDGITCFGGDDCYLLIYGIPSLMIFIGVVALLVGRRFSILLSPGGNMIGKVFGCIWVGLLFELILPEKYLNFLDSNLC
jgi:solute carrier family 15 (oligopeptide transporter), member 1